MQSVAGVECGAQGLMTVNRDQGEFSTWRDIHFPLNTFSSYGNLYSWHSYMNILFCHFIILSQLQDDFYSIDIWLYLTLCFWKMETYSKKNAVPFLSSCSHSCWVYFNVLVKRQKILCELNASDATQTCFNFYWYILQTTAV